MSILFRSELAALPGTILATEPFRPIIVTFNGANVKFYQLTVLSPQDYADAGLSYDEKTIPKFFYERGFIIQHYTAVREVLGFRDQTNTFHLLSSQPRYIARCQYTGRSCEQNCATGTCASWDDEESEARDPIVRRQRRSNHDCEE